jgi:hypothetical protein
MKSMQEMYDEIGNLEVEIAMNENNNQQYRAEDLMRILSQ